MDAAGQCVQLKYLSCRPVPCKQSHADGIAEQFHGISYKLDRSSSLQLSQSRRVQLQ